MEQIPRGNETNPDSTTPLVPYFSNLILCLPWYNQINSSGSSQFDVLKEGIVVTLVQYFQVVLKEVLVHL